MDHPIPLKVLNTHEQEDKCTKISLNPRTETAIKINIANPEIKEGIISKCEIQDGVYLASSIVKVDKTSQAMTTVLNTTNQLVTLPNLSIVLQPIESLLSYDLHKINDHSTEQQKLHSNYRNEILVQSLRLDHLSQEEKESLLNICKEYNSIFHLEGDTLPETTLIEHAIIQHLTHQ